MASSSTAYLCHAILPCMKSRFRHPSLQVRAQRYSNHHEGKSSNIVDTNLRVLRERIEEVKTKERLERCCVAEIGWNYEAVDMKYYSLMKHKREKKVLIEIVGMIGATFGLTILTCSFCLFFISLLVHLNYQ